MKSFVRFSFMFAVVLSGAIGNAHSDVDLATLAPWIHGEDIHLGMTRSAFVLKRPSAKNVYFGDSPADTTKPFTGQYVEGNPQDKGRPFFIYIFKDDYLLRVHWGVQPTDIEKETHRIRHILQKKYGEPTFGALPRLNVNGEVERLSMETYRSNGLTIMIAASTPGGIEASFYKSDNDGAGDFDRLLEKLDKSGRRIHSRTRTIDDVLARLWELQ